MLKTVGQLGLSAYGHRKRSQDRREPGERDAEVRSLAVESGQKQVLERSVLSERLADRAEKEDDVLAPAESVLDPLKMLLDLPRLGRSDRSCRTRSKAVENDLDRPRATSAARRRKTR
jgi:hypothetical protein